MKKLKAKLILMILMFLVSIHYSKADCLQSTNTVVMVSPDNFSFNTQTEKSNFFQKDVKEIEKYNNLCKSEFDNMVNVLRKNGIKVIVLSDLFKKNTPDSIFPNNWFSTHTFDNNHKNKILVTYPMLAMNRRLERQPDELIEKLDEEGINFNKVIDLSRFERKDVILESTGSLVLDRTNKIVYTSLSSRANFDLVNLFCKKLGYFPILFHAYDKNKKPIYHTNVMMSIGSKFVILALENISDMKEKINIINTLQLSGKEIIAITPDQVNEMAGNILELESDQHIKKIIISQRAFNSLTEIQKRKLSKYGQLIPIAINTIESIGGGSVRCMLAEIF